MKHLLAPVLLGLFTAALALAGCDDEPPVDDFCELIEDNSRYLWEVCTSDEQCVPTLTCGVDRICSWECEQNSDCDQYDGGSCYLGACTYACEAYEGSGLRCDDLHGIRVSLCEECGARYCPWFGEWADG